MKEADLSRSIQIAASRLGARLFRNNVGILEDKRGQKVAYGLCVGSSDLIGWTATGQFLAVEVKVPTGKGPTERQSSFIDAVRAAGGRAGVARSIADLERILSD